jgi:spore germination cell wall hydrolase CwlJ-like protein
MTLRSPSRAGHEFAQLRLMIAICATALGLALSTAVALAPDHSADLLAAAPAPTLVRENGTLRITGSLDALFQSASFIGTNRALKQDRVRAFSASVDDFTASFSDIRARIAAVRTALVERKVKKPDLVAELAPAPATPALTAIDGLAETGTNAPKPSTMSAKLAYARADQPTDTPQAIENDGAKSGTKTKSGKAVSEKDLWCMATAIYFESRGETYRGQVAVGQVVMNRLAHPLYPKTICAVVFQNEQKRNACQFSFACDGIPETVTDKKSWAQAMKIAKNVIAGRDRVAEVGHATHYHALYVRPDWAPRMKKVTKIGLHVFYQFKRGWRFG